MVKLILITALILGVAIAGIAIKMFLKKDGQFTKSCSSVDPKSGKNVACTCHSNNSTDCNNEN